LGLRDFNIREVLLRAGFPAEAHKAVGQILRQIYGIAIKSDATLVEINPLVLTGDGRVVALDGKMELDDNALYRQKALIAEVGREAEGDESQHPLEKEAAEKGLAYVKVDGSVGIIGNGAGLVMTTLDMIQRYGGKPANFLDIGGGAKAEVVKNALGIVLSDPQVRSVLINVFGGITRGDEVAKGLLSVVNEVKPKVPIVVRLAGTRSEEGRRLLEGSPLIPAKTFQEAAQKAVELAAAGGVNA
ncbi:MAG TPA: ATP-grasp domain-containing protein, partial [Limnochordia bacterium]|nr:ATP-grasp domain-containing protein [Limnochordia bacterium]